MEGEIEGGEKPGTPKGKAKAQLKPDSPKAAPVEPAEDSVPTRKIAQGAVTRVRKQRRKWNRQQSDDEEDDNYRKGNNRIARSGGKHTYNLHMTPQGTRHSEIPAILLG